MAHYECDECGKVHCFGECVERKAQQEKELQERLGMLEISEGDLFLIERTITLIQIAQPSMTYAHGMLFEELLQDLKERIYEKSRSKTPKNV